LALERLQLLDVEQILRSRGLLFESDQISETDERRDVTRTNLPLRRVLVRHIEVEWRLDEQIDLCQRMCRT
jgi:hypothetical protein